MEPSTISKDKFLQEKIVKFIGESGDILVRKSDGRGPYGIPFMRWVAKYTRSKYTHAALLVMEAGDPWVFEVTDIGTLKLRFVDWIEFSPDGSFALYRATGLTSAQKHALLEQIIIFLMADRDYDFTFSDDHNLYCTEAVCLLYQAVGINLQTPKYLKDIVRDFIYETTIYPRWFKNLLTQASVWALVKLNGVCLKATGGKMGLPLNIPLYYVGAEDTGGILAYKGLEKIL